MSFARATKGIIQDMTEAAPTASANKHSPSFLNDETLNTIVQIDQRTRRIPLLTQEDLEMAEFAEGLLSR